VSSAASAASKLSGPSSRDDHESAKKQPSPASRRRRARALPPSIPMLTSLWSRSVLSPSLASAIPCSGPGRLQVAGRLP